MAIPTIEKHFEENWTKLLKRMTFRAGDEWNAEDVIQEAYCRALKYYKSFDGTNFDRWFSTILNNTLREFKNIEKHGTLVEFDEEEMEGTACTSYSLHVMAQIYQMIEKLTPIKKEVLTLYFHQEYTARDISRLTPYTYSQVHQIIQRFRNELKELYRE